MKVRSLISEVSVVFDRGEQRAAEGPLYEPVAQRVKTDFAFQKLAYTEQETELAWVANKGLRKIGSSNIRIDRSVGNARVLGVGVEAQHAVAIDVLEELWRLLNMVDIELFGGNEASIQSIKSMGTLVTQTMAVVESPISFDKLMPQAAFLRDAVLREAASSAFVPEDNPQIRFTIQTQFKITGAGRRYNAPITFEPRAMDQPGANLIFTRSPLPDDAHVAMVKSFIEASHKPAT